MAGESLELDAGLSPKKDSKNERRQAGREGENE